MEKVTVELGKRSYNIIISSDLFKDPTSFLPLKSGDKVMLVTSKTPALLYLNKIRYVLETENIKVDVIVLCNSSGEENKNLITLNLVFTELIKKKHGRDTILIALGGGGIGDLTGFAAASYQRGVRFIQVPTTLLSQVDSSIGGKTAINHKLGKNMIGAFHQPISVVTDINCLKTLPKRQLGSGLAEVIKYAIALDRNFFFWLEKNMDALLCLDIKTIKYCICHCCKLKANIIAADEYENGLRALLNLGHTYGHAIETAMGYGNWLHGEAISVGIIIVARISEKLGILRKEETQRIITLFKRAGLPEQGPKEMSAEKYMSYITRDKKILEGKLRLILPLSIGKSKMFTGISKDIMIQILSEF